jgi:hypothetical protein
MLLLQLAFCLEPIVHVVAVYATAFEVQDICSLLDFLQTRGASELWLGPCKFSHPCSLSSIPAATTFAFM